MVSMKRVSVMLAAVCLSIGIAYGIGDQHGLFRSQSTQGPAWQGTAEIEEERYTITVYPDYLDVELEWVFRVGGTEPDSFANALEIVGNLNLVDKSVVVGMITWWKGDILKGKLKTTEVARAAYEEVVQRDSEAPPPPRDPVLLEWVRDDNYDISIFPVTFGETRKVRFRYLIPALRVEGENKILYPHAFTDHAEVSVRAGPGVESYKVQTVNEVALFTDRTLAPLDAADYSFQAYGGGGGERISHIVPVCGEESTGSRIYVGEVAVGELEGQMLHVATMTAPEALAKTGLAEDFVILWRWNHPEVLARYARQIVEQSKLLQAFLATLASADKRAALIIDKEGGERITFRLDSQGGTAYRRMVAYLEELAATAIVDPPTTTTPPSYEMSVDAQKAQEQLEDALRAAIAMFEENSDAIRHLLILTAGPRLVHQWVDQQPIELDSTVAVNMLSTYLEGAGLEVDVPSSARTIYWPGTNPGDLLGRYTLDLTVQASLSNGTDTSMLGVLVPPDKADTYGRPWSETRKHLFSDRPVRESITWRVLRGGEVLAQFEETPQVVRLSDGTQYARLIGSSPHLTPMARSMPRSLAATLGFIDEQYALVALEEDKLPAELARQYEQSGVPLPAPEDIFASPSDQALIPSDEWLALNPPESMGGYLHDGGWEGDMRRYAPTVFMLENGVIDAAAPPADGKNVEDVVLMPMPVASRYYPNTSATYEDYSDALSARSTHAPSLLTGPRAFVKNGRLSIDLAGFTTADRTHMRVAVYDLAGRLVYVWNGRQLASCPRPAVSLSDARLSHGTYIVRIAGRGIQLAERVVIR
jgi:hypothetical protein